MKKKSSSLLCAVASCLLLGLNSHVYGKDTLCQFQARGLSMNFPPLDPSSNIDVPAQVSVATFGADTAGDCTNNITMEISAVNTSPLVLKNTNTSNSDTIPYSLIGLPIYQKAPGNNKWASSFTFTLSGMILAKDYADVSAGTYTDSVTILVKP